MTREIKFRAWHRGQSKMFPVKTMDFINDKDDKMLLRTDSGIGYIIANKRQCDIMQYTGLKDKNGVEIYEGDIFRYKLPISGVTLTKTIEWENTDACFFLWDGNADNEQSRFSKGLAGYGEVIGNVYSNPELIEVK